MNNKGKLILSTKSSFAVRKAVIGIGGLFFIVLAILMIANSKPVIATFAKMCRNETLGSMITVFLIGFFILYPVFMFILISLQSRSYCEIHENCIIGKTAMNKWDIRSMQDFEIPYSDISNVSEDKYSIVIYTQYANYKVLANTNRADALKEIRQRIGK